MFKKAMLCAAALAMVVAFGFANKSFAEDKGPETIVLNSAAAKKPVTFPHAAHQGRIECKVCHESEGFPASADAWTKDLGHALCKDCHKKEKASTKCGTCHKK